MRKAVTIVLLLCLLLPVMAVKKRVMKISKPKVEAEIIEEDPRITQMLEATQKIIFIDSIVVNSDEVLGAINIDPQAGSVSMQGHDFSYTNELGNQHYYVSKGKLYTKELLIGEWSDGKQLEGIADTVFIDQNYPFMMSDGTTLYFAAKGKESIGGYDIFVTRFDTESGRYLKPENIGMPFNSEANDYLYVIDEMNEIGYFVTDRRQPQGKVCVYTFIPATSRETYDDGPNVKSYAQIMRIADTWGNGVERKKALQRLKDMTSKETQEQHDFYFIVDDNTTYTSLRDFKKKENINNFIKLNSMRSEYSKLCEDLDKERAYYAKASSEERGSLSGVILRNERLREYMEQNIKRLEKEIRNSELKQ